MFPINLGNYAGFEINDRDWIKEVDTYGDVPYVFATGFEYGGLRLGDSVSKVVDLYGESYSFASKTGNGDWEYDYSLINSLPFYDNEFVETFFNDIETMLQDNLVVTGMDADEYGGVVYFDSLNSAGNKNGVGTYLFSYGDDEYREHLFPDDSLIRKDEMEYYGFYFNNQVIFGENDEELEEQSDMLLELFEDKEFIPFHIQISATNGYITSMNIEISPEGAIFW